MATQYTSILKLALPTQGELSGSWGDVVNDNITSMVEEAIAGLATINTWTNDSHTLTSAFGTTSESRAAILVLTDTNTELTGAGEVICPDASKVYIVKNDAGQTVTVKTASGTGVAISDGTTKLVVCDGTNVGATTADANLASNASGGTDNVLLGENALGGTGAGSENVAIGSGALSSNSNTKNTAVGYRAMDTSTSQFSTAIGADALRETTASWNMGIGYLAGTNLTSGSFNVFVGTETATAATTGNQNTCLGWDAGGFGTLTTGSVNILLGARSRPSSPTASGECTLGYTDITSLRCNVTTISSLSDLRDKTDIVDSPYGLDTLEKVKVRQFKWDTRRGNIKDGTSEIGFIAQELLEVGDNDLLNLVMDDNPEFLEAKPAALIPVLVKAIQELSEKVKRLEANQNV